MRKVSLWLLLLFGFFLLPAYANRNGILIEVDGPKVEASRVFDLAESLNFTGEAMPGFWRIAILDRETWDDAVQRYNVDTETAFTILGQNVTFLNEDYLLGPNGWRVRHTLAHESGHMICECASEDVANQIAVRLER